MKFPVAFDQLMRFVEHEAHSNSALDRLRVAVGAAEEVNSVADRVMDHFVQAARADGCTWAEIGAELGVSKQAAQQRFVARPTGWFSAGLRPIELSGRGRRRRGFFSTFTPAARQAIAAAQEQARNLGHASVGSEHLVLSVLGDAESPAAKALAALGIERGALRRRVVKVVGVGYNHSEESIPFAPEAKKVLELALREGLRSSAKEVTPEHILLAVVREPGTVGAQILASEGASAEAVESALRNVA